MNKEKKMIIRKNKNQITSADFVADEIEISNMSIRIMYMWMTGKPMADDMTISQAMSTVVSSFPDWGFGSDNKGDIVTSIEGDENVDAFKTMVRKANDVSWNLAACSMILHEDEELRGLIDKYAISRGFMNTIEQ